jgi:hypothetical protein
MGDSEEEELGGFQNEYSDTSGSEKVSYVTLFSFTVLWRLIVIIFLLCIASFSIGLYFAHAVLHG